MILTKYVIEEEFDFEPIFIIPRDKINSEDEPFITINRTNNPEQDRVIANRILDFLNGE